MPKPILLVAGTRPNLIKVAPITWEMDKRGVEYVLQYTGQHYDPEMSDIFFQDLEIPTPHYKGRRVGSTAVEMIGNVMRDVERAINEKQPSAVVVFGDVNSTLAAALAAVNCHIPLAHVEAGLRSFDRSMPEEINRLLVDAVSDVLFVTERSGVENLRKEGVPDGKIHHVGNVMVDTLLRYMDAIKARPMVADVPYRYAVLTLHRPSNVDNDANFQSIASAIKDVAKTTPIVFPVHPRTRARMGSLRDEKNILMVDPLGYLDFHRLLSGAKFILTDSGGIQEEAVIHKVPCITLRHNTERPITITCGWNVVAGTSPRRILQDIEWALELDKTRMGTPVLWDGKTAGRIVDVLLDFHRAQE